MTQSAFKFSVAPMMEWTDRHYRYLARLMSRHTRLYTEMVTTGALVHGERERFLKYNAAEHPLALQLGGSDPEAMRRSAEWGQQAGYDEININVGCPSDRVQSGRFGVCLMREPEQVAACVQAMRAATHLPVTVKCRIGVDHDDSYAFLQTFIEQVAVAGCDTFIIHARKAWLQGLSPKQNREIPELDYARVYQLKRDYPQLTIIINGGIQTLADIHSHLRFVDGVMVGRQAYKHPQLLLQIDQALFGTAPPVSDLHEVVRLYIDYVETNLRQGVPLHSMTKHILNLYQGVPGAKLWRRHLSENSHKPGMDSELIVQAHAKLIQH
ncbi:MAG: tRNA dihydrouridine(20/20a) synthase DusA [Gammaproteobacteria bacterium TMED119]|nr:MAG: tRNA dihydrouridine(20/20a) synthase DusA [Gammaproteobacteria bacterium TMED119]